MTTSSIDVRPPGRTTSVRVTPNAFGIALGLAGLAGAWRAAHHAGLAPAWPGVLLLALQAGTWLALVVAWPLNVRRSGRRWAQELADPVFGPFTAVAPVTAMLFGVGLADLTPAAGRVVVEIAAVVSVLLAAWFNGHWLRGGLSLDALHPGYLLPTVAGSLVAAYGLAVVGRPGAAMALFGLGLICWLLLGSLVLLRLVTGSPLPPGLVPTMAINLAPPVVACNAYLALSGQRFDAVAHALAGFSLLLVLSELTLVPVYRRLPFSLSFWAFTFPYAAAVTTAVQWLVHGYGDAARPIVSLLLGLITAFVAVVAARSVVALRRGTFFARVPAPVSGL